MSRCPGVTIHWTVGTAAGTLSASTSVTDAAGHASVLHTLGAGAGTQTVSASIDGSSQTPVVFSTTALGAAAAVRVAMVPIPPTYGIHDTFVRDGLAFVSAWDAGLIIYDVGNGIRGGSPSRPIEVSRIVPPAGAVDRHGGIDPQCLVVPQSRPQRKALRVPGAGGAGHRRRRCRGATSTPWMSPTWRTRRWSGVSASRARARTTSGWTRQRRCSTRPTTMPAWSRSTCRAC